MSDISEEDDEFDPMTDDYNDPKFNSYKSGPGSYINPHFHTQKGWETKSENFKLYVSSIPLGINMTGFQNIFSNFGNPLNTFLGLARSQSCKFGFVEYKSLVQAQRAIISVNNVPPLNLTVKFAMSEEARINRNEHKLESPLATLEECTKQNMKSTEKIQDRSRGRGHLLLAFKGLKPKDMISTYSWHTPYNSFYSQSPESHPHGEFSIYKGDEILDAYHDALTYVKPVVTNNHHNVLHMGRGYSLKDIPKYADRYFPQSEKILSYSNEEEMTKYKCKSCCLCGKEAMRFCYNCRYWYCSKICFRYDSPNHSVNSSGLVMCHNFKKLDELKSSSNENLFSPTKNQNDEQGVCVKKLIFPPLGHITGQSEESNQELNCRQNRELKAVGNRNSHLNRCHYLRNSNDLMRVQTEALINISDNCCIRKTQNRSYLPLPDDLLIPSTSFTLVKISFPVDEICYWVNKTSDSNTLFNITKTLFTYCKSSNSKPLSDVQPSVLCAALIDGYWCRAKIKSISSDSVVANLIDFGREETCPLSNLKTLPQESQDLPPLAFKIVLADGTPENYQSLTDSDEISIKPVAVDDNGAIVVQVENETYSDDSCTDLLESSFALSSDSSVNQSVSNNVNILEEVDGPLPMNCYTTVRIDHVVSRNEFYVTLCSLWEELLEMAEILNVMGKKKPPILEPVVDEMYIKNFEDCWCRAKVLGLEPLRIFYIDYGNEEVIESYNQELRVLPSSISTSRFPPMAFRIKMAERTSDEYLNSLKPLVDCRIKPVSKEGDTYVVVAEGYDYTSESSSSNDLLPQPTARKSLNKEEISHLLSTVEICKRFELTVNQVMSKDRVCGSLNLNPSFSHGTQTDIENEICKSNIQLDRERIDIGAEVACLTREGVCGRGYVMSVIESTTRVALVDLGYVSTADKLCQVPPSLKNIPEAAVSCKFLQPQNNIQIGCKLNFRRAKIVGNEVHCEAKNYGSCVLTLWKPRLENGGLPCLNLKSGSKVIISSYYSPQVCYVQSAEHKQIISLDALLQDVAVYSSSAPVLDRDPEMGEVIACLYPEDQNFYRAQVYRKIGKLFSVIFLDFGNSYDVSPSDMRILCDSLKMVPCQAVKVSLKDVNENIFTADALNFLNVKCSKSESFYLEYEESLKNAVLKSSDGISLNKLINDMVNPHWKQCLEEGTDPTNGEVFFSEDVTYLQWEIKTRIKLIIVKQVSGNVFMVINSEDGMLDFMRDWFTPRITDYCSSFDEDYHYVPRNWELCFVKMQDDDRWYRALCVHVYDISCWVIFVDFANYGEVNFKHVRPTPFEFLQVPSILKKCIISGMPERLPNEDAQRKLSETLSEGSVQEAVIIEDEGKGVVTAYFEAVAKIAHEIGVPTINEPC